MNDATPNANETLQVLGQGDLSVLNTLMRMT